MSTPLNASSERLWQAYLATLPPDAPQRQRYPIAEPFGDTPGLANRLGGLIVAGTKTATCSTVWEWEAQGAALPQPGFLTIVLDGAGEPLCLIETTEVTLRRFDEVDAAFAYDEGEGDRSLAYWRQAHVSFFSRTLPALGHAVGPDMMLVCERFRVLYRAGQQEPR